MFALGYLYLAQLEIFHPCHVAFWPCIPFTCSFSRRFAFLIEFPCFCGFFPFSLSVLNVWKRVCTCLSSAEMLTHVQHTRHPTLSVVILSNYILTSLISLPWDVGSPSPTNNPFFLFFLGLCELSCRQAIYFFYFLLFLFLGLSDVYLATFLCS